MSSERARAIAERAGNNARAKASASKAVLLALRHLEDEDKRDRSGFLQADIPSQIKAELAEVAKAKGTTVTALIFDLLSEWINPNTGTRRVRKNKNGLRSYTGPGNYRKYTRLVDEIYSEASRRKTLVRIQVEVKDKIGSCIDGLLYESGVSKGRFLTALAVSVIRRNQNMESRPTQTAEENG